MLHNEKKYVTINVFKKCIRTCDLGFEGFSKHYVKIDSMKKIYQ